MTALMLCVASCQANDGAKSRSECCVNLYFSVSVCGCFNTYL